MTDDFANAPSRWRFRHIPAVLGAMLLLLYSRYLWSSAVPVMGAIDGDGPPFVAWREFAFGQIRAGHLPCWNPYLFSGTPFVGNPQSAMFYPPNWIYFFLPLALACNWNYVGHLFLAGCFTAFWGRRRGMHPAAALLSGSLLMLGGPYVLKVRAGHQVPLDAMAWTPLILMCVDFLTEEGALFWAVLGAGAVALQFLAGYPQTVFMTGVAALVLLVSTIHRSNYKIPSVVGLAAMYAAAVPLAAVQLWPSAQLLRETSRPGGLPYSYARLFSFPPENLFTLAAPQIFGGYSGLKYWGEYELWDVSLYMSVAGIALAVFGLVYGREKQRVPWAASAIILIVLAFGSYSPLYGLLYRYVPPFNEFRANCKFIVEAAVFIALLAGVGLDTLIRSSRGARTAAAAAGMLGMASAVSAIAIVSSLSEGTEGVWGRIVAWFGRSDAAVIPVDRASQAVWVVPTGNCAVHAIELSAASWFAVAGLMALRNKASWPPYALLALAALELGLFANGDSTGFQLGATRSPGLQLLLASEPGDYRIHQIGGFVPNENVYAGARDIWGYDATILNRYAMLFAHTQGEDPDEPAIKVSFRRLSPLLGLLRCRYLYGVHGDQKVIARVPGDLPHALLIRDYAVIPRRDDIFAALDDPHFAMDRTALLETSPGLPRSGNVTQAPNRDAATVSLVDTDESIVSATVSKPEMLLLTDPYSTGWHAVAMPGSAQRTYRIMPADYALLAIPLMPGRHRIRLVYAPWQVFAGRAITEIALPIYCLVAFVSFRRYRAVESSR